MPRPYNPKIKTLEEKAFNIAVGKKLKNARINRIVCKYNLDPNGNRNAFYIKKFCPQVELAKALGVAFQQIGKYEKGESGLSAYRLLQVTKFLNISRSDLLEIDSIDNDVPKLVGQYEPPINSSDKDRDCSLSTAEL